MRLTISSTISAISFISKSSWSTVQTTLLPGSVEMEPFQREMETMHRTNDFMEEWQARWGMQMNLDRDWISTFSYIVAMTEALI